MKEQIMHLRLTQLTDVYSLPYKVHKIDISKNTQKEEWVSLMFPFRINTMLTADSS